MRIFVDVHTYLYISKFRRILNFACNKWFYKQKYKYKNKNKYKYKYKYKYNINTNTT